EHFAALRVIGGEARPRKIRLDAARAAAIAARPWLIVTIGKRQRIVAPLARDRVGALEDAPLDDDAAAHAGAEDDAEADSLGARPGSRSGGATREAIASSGAG